MNWLDAQIAARVGQETKEWEEREVAAFLKKQAERQEQFFTIGDFQVSACLRGRHRRDAARGHRTAGRLTCTRSPYPTMYRSRTWTMRQIAGFGTGEDTNRRFKYLIAQGQTGISTDFDMRTLMGYDSDHPMSEGEVGREGVAIDTLADMEALLADIDPRRVSRCRYDQPDPWILLAMYVAREQRSYNPRRSGHLQADILRSTWRRKETSTRSRRRSASAATSSRTRRGICRATTRSTSPATTSAKPGRRRCRRRRSRSPT